MKKASTIAMKQCGNISQPTLTIGLDLGDRNSWYCVLNEAGQIQLEQRVRTTAKALGEVFGAMARSRIALETGADQGSGHADRADVPVDAGRSTSLWQEPRRGLLSGIATGTQKLGTERTADAHQQRRRPVSAHAAGAGSAAYLGAIRHRL